MISWAIVLLAFILGGALVYFWRASEIARSAARAATLDEMLREERKIREKVFADNQLSASLDDLKKEFKSHQALIQKSEKEQAQLYGGIESSIRQIVDVGQAMRMEAAALKKALTSSAGVQGNMGQILLEDILERNGLQKGRNYRTQVVFEGEAGGSLRPDVIIELPGHKELVVDSKAPIQEYILAGETDDPARQKEHSQRLVANMRDHINKLSRKEYQRLLDSDIRFVLMFVPEGPIRTACSADPTLLQHAQEKNVLLTSPMTLIPLIQLIAYSWKQYQLASGAKELDQEVEAFGQRLFTFLEHLSDVQGGLKKAQAGWNKAVSSWQTRLSPQLEKIKGLGGKLKELPEPEPIEGEVADSPLQKKPNLLE